MDIRNISRQPLNWAVLKSSFNVCHNNSIYFPTILMSNIAIYVNIHVCRLYYFMSILCILKCSSLFHVQRVMIFFLQGSATTTPDLDVLNNFHLWEQLNVVLPWPVRASSKPIPLSPVESTSHDEQGDDASERESTDDTG